MTNVTNANGAHQVLHVVVPGYAVPHRRRTVNVRPPRQCGGCGFRHFKKAPHGKDSVVRPASVTTEESRRYTSLLREHAYKAVTAQRWRIPQRNTPIRLGVVVYFPWPASTGKKKRATQAGALMAERPDLDNLLKQVNDALSAPTKQQPPLVYWDDGQVAELHCAKRRCNSGEERVEIRVQVAEHVPAMALAMPCPTCGAERGNDDPGW